MSSGNFLPGRSSIRYRTSKCCVPRSFCLRLLASQTTKSLGGSTLGGKWSACGASASSRNGCGGLKNAPARVVLGPFPPEVVVQIKALACELPSLRNLPLSRWSVAEVATEARRSGIVATISDSTIWRWLNEDAIRPWQHRCWIFPRDPNFAVRAGNILDLYERVWQGQALKADEFVLSADEKTSIQARARLHPTLPTQPRSVMKVEHEYQRCGAWAYLAALDVHRAKLFGRCEAKTGIAPFERLVAQVMTQLPYNEARRVFLIVDNGSSHRGQSCIARLQARYPRLVVVHGPIHASWLNQIEIYFSILERKALTPNDFASLPALAERIIDFQNYYESIAKPFEWKFTRRDLNEMLNKMKGFSNNIRRAA